MICPMCKEKEKITMIHEGCRDDKNVNVMKCINCGIVFLDSIEKITSKLYQDSGMHQEKNFDYNNWLKQTYFDDKRRSDWICKLISKENAEVCDFGCGNGGFLRILQKENSKLSCYGVELEEDSRHRINEDGIICKRNLNEYENKKFDVITMFHVIEHLVDPQNQLSEIRKYLKNDGILIIETPNADDVLLSRYKCKSFEDFTYWSLHVFLYNSKTLESIVQKTGYEVIENKQIQRYPFTNHIFWLSHGQPGGHDKLKDYFSEELNKFYVDSLRERGECDTLLMITKLKNTD